jgi:hypothetical protein
MVALGVSDKDAMPNDGRDVKNQIVRRGRFD